ncbi:PTS fructose transporter subunit IIA [Candidatus Sodalis endolongispinus]|uniref:PTS fructose transporter subunit IIA n=1 Tax=Candidatus Sodalis endolongispinus TaxID=2812662 RepID=A0ABS5YCC7_9GAMM|nr:PTS fructose transporter subunit IIA [Candidatus Sodalis endolongispinus]MBT9432622.1 PTS fructose transporter subunit IIA [Candidatus Sodalis endolongispinus]
MQEIYVASHGEYAKGIVSALSLLIGDDHGVTPVCGYCGDISNTAELEQYQENVALLAAHRGNEVFLFTDMLGGSVNNTAILVMMRHPQLHVIAGANLIMLMEFCLSEEPATASRITAAIAMATDGMCYVNRLPEIVLAARSAAPGAPDHPDDFFTGGASS